MELTDLRSDYVQRTLSEEAAGAEPMALLERWLGEAIEAQVPEPNAMTLSTVAADGTPSSRIVLLRGVDHGLTFFTNYRSRKGQELAGRSKACALLFWPTLERQVRVGGRVERLTSAESDAYFASRPHKSRLAALASAQSQPCSRPELEARFFELCERYPEGTEVPRPDHWGGYRLLPTQIELWQGGAHRLHDRIEFLRAEGAQEWRKQRLSP